MIHGKLALLTLAGALALAAPSAEATVNGRERRQAERLRQGVLSGELTSREATRLSAQQARIRAEERRYRSDDGRLGPRERADLQRDLSRASRRIYRQAHDGQER